MAPAMLPPPHVHETVMIPASKSDSGTWRAVLETSKETVRPCASLEQSESSDEVDLVECDNCHGQGRIWVGGFLCPRELVDCGVCGGVGGVPEDDNRTGRRS